MTANGHLAHDCRIRNGAKTGGLISADWCLESFADVLLALPDDLSKDTVLRPELRLPVSGAGEEGLAIYYAPFEMVNPNAKVVLVGITPSRGAMFAAIEAARKALLRKPTGDEVLETASIAGSFGPKRGRGSVTRKNLVTMLDGIGLKDALELETSTAQLFSKEHRRLVDMTSAISFPTFRTPNNRAFSSKGELYNGTSPGIDRSPVAKAFIDNVLAGQLEISSNALIIPLGKPAAAAVNRCVQSGRVEPERCLIGFPHPSPQSSTRQSTFEKNQKLMTAAVKDWFASGRGTVARP